jgi:hypothetical protein
VQVWGVLMRPRGAHGHGHAGHHGHHVLLVRPGQEDRTALLRGNSSGLRHVGRGAGHHDAHVRRVHHDGHGSAATAAGRVGRAWPGLQHLHGHRAGLVGRPPGHHLLLRIVHHLLLVLLHLRNCVRLGGRCCPVPVHLRHNWVVLVRVLRGAAGRRLSMPRAQHGGRVKVWMGPSHGGATVRMLRAARQRVRSRSVGSRRLLWRL